MLKEFQKKTLIERFLGEIELKSGQTKKLFVFGFVGLNGVGKSFVAEKISQKLGLYIASNDKVRRFMNKQGLEDTNLIQELVQEIAPATSLYLYENKLSHIIDADLIEFWDVARKNAQKYGANLYLLHLICPEKVILSRIEQRNLDVVKNPVINLSRVTGEEYFKRKKIHASLPLPEIFLTINTAEDLEQQLAVLILKLKKEKVL